MNERLLNEITKKIKSANKEIIYLSFDELLEYEKDLCDIFGKEGFVLYTQKRAIVCFDSKSNIRWYVNHDKYFSKNNFKLKHLDLNVIGRGKEELLSPIQTFWDDIKHLKLLIALFTIIFLSIFNFTEINISGLSILNESLINVTSIFIGTLFVFIGFSYGDKERTIETYKKGLGDKEYFNDKYIIKLSIIIITLLIISQALCSYPIKSGDRFKLFFLIEIGKFINTKVLYCTAMILTGSSIILLTTCFYSLINYYLSRIRNKYLIDAVDELANEREKKQ